MRYARSQYFWVQNFQGIHIVGFEFYPPYAHPRIQIWETPPDLEVHDYDYLSNSGKYIERNLKEFSLVNATINFIWCKKWVAHLKCVSLKS